MTHTTFAPKDKEQRRVALIDAANAIFAERGYDCATTREIAERAGCAEGLIHRYFAGKRGLLLAILQHKGQEVSREWSATLPDRESVHEEIEALLLYDIDSKVERSNFLRICVSQAAIDPEIGAAVRDGVRAAQLRFVIAKLQKHREAGHIRPDVDIEAVATAINGLGFAIGFMYIVAFGGASADAERIALESADAIAHGISSCPQSKEYRP
jgi:TetR/AcrR family transcriptional regulator, regulator of cefoperazone and chloramphenicol sensitivity